MALNTASAAPQQQATSPAGQAAQQLPGVQRNVGTPLANAMQGQRPIWGANPPQAQPPENGAPIQAQGGMNGQPVQAQGGGLTTSPQPLPGTSSGTPTQPGGGQGQPPGGWKHEPPGHLMPGQQGITGANPFAGMAQPAMMKNEPGTHDPSDKNPFGTPAQEAKSPLSQMLKQDSAATIAKEQAQQAAAAAKAKDKKTPPTTGTAPLPSKGKDPGKGKNTGKGNNPGNKNK